MLNAEMIIKRIEEAGNSYFEQRCKTSYMLGMAEGEIKSLVRRLNSYETGGAIRIRYRGKWLTVDGDYTPYLPDTSWEPGEPENFEVEKVWLHGDNIIDLFDDDQIDEIAELCIQRIKQEEADIKAERAHDNYVDKLEWSQL